MAKKRMFLMGILGAFLVFGLVVLGCDNGSNDDDNGDGGNWIVGTWENPSYLDQVLRLNFSSDGSFIYTIIPSGLSAVVQNGTYTVDGNNFTTHIGPSTATGTKSDDTHLTLGGVVFTKK